MPRQAASAAGFATDYGSAVVKPPQDLDAWRRRNSATSSGCAPESFFADRCSVSRRLCESHRSGKGREPVGLAPAYVVKQARALASGLAGLGPGGHHASANVSPLSRRSRAVESRPSRRSRLVLFEARPGATAMNEIEEPRLREPSRQA